MVAADEYGEAGGTLGARKILMECAHLLVHVMWSALRSAAAAGHGALVRASHAAQVLRAAHRLEVAAYEKKLHLRKFVTPPAARRNS